MLTVVHKITVSYVGTAYAGWQRQERGQTVQGELEKAVKLIWGETIHVEGSGRTDAGVHSRGQTAGFLAPKKMNAAPFCRAMNYHLPPDIQISKVEFMEPSFHARFDVCEKTYEYILWNDRFLNPFLLNRVWHIPQPLDILAMQRAAAALVGKHDFASFATNSRTVRRSTVRDLRRLIVEKKASRVTIRATADGFLYHMVRNLTGALVKVGKGKLSEGEIATLLHTKRRELAPAAAPAFGLYLDRVAYFPKRIRLERLRLRKERQQMNEPEEVES